MRVAAGPTDDLIGRIYDEIGAEVPWQDALGAVCAAVGAQTLALQMTMDRASDQTYFIPAGARTAPQHITEWERRSRDQQISLALPPGQVDTCNDYLARRPRAAFVELIRRYDVARGMSARVARIGAADYSLHALRPGRDDPFGPAEEALFQRIVPHLARAIGLRSELAAARDRASAYGDVLARIGVGMIRVDAGRQVIAVNDCAAALLGVSGLMIADGRIAARDRDLAARLRQGLAQVLAVDAIPGAQTALALDGGVSALLRATPVEEPTIGRHLPAATLLVVGAPVLDDRAVAALRALFGLTAAEAAVGVHLAMGRDAKAIQAAMGIRYTTLRTHIAQLFVKLDCARQGELIHRLARLLPVLQ